MKAVPVYISPRPNRLVRGGNGRRGLTWAATFRPLLRLGRYRYVVILSEAKFERG